MPHPPEILCIGETMVLVHPAEVAPLEQAESFELSHGGAESNVALYLCSRGHPTAWLSRVGDDPLGRRLLTQIARHGVDVSRVVVTGDAPTAVYFKDPGPKGTTVYYYRRGSAASRMDASDIDAVDLDGVRVVYLSGITAGLSESCARMISAAMDKAKHHGALVAFDVNFRSGVWQAEKAAPRLLELARRADVTWVGRDEAETLWGTSTPEKIAAHVAHPGRLVIKDGDVGATEFHRGTSTFVASHPVDVVEPVGAGDAFAAGYLSGLLEGRDAEACLRLGHDLAIRALTSLSDFNPSAFAASDGELTAPPTTLS